MKNFTKRDNRVFPIELLYIAALIGLILSSAQTASAKLYTYAQTGVVNVSGIGDTATSFDKLYPLYSNPNWTNDYYNRQIKNRIIVNIDRGNLNYISNRIELDVTLLIESDKLIGGSVTPQSAFSKTVKLVYDPAQTATEIDQVVLTYDDVVFSRATVTNIVITGSSLTYPAGKLPVIQLENRTEIERVFNLDRTPINPNALTISKTNQNRDGDFQYITMNWPLDTMAEAYEVEFLFVHDPVSRTPGAIALTSVDVDFSHNATRIRIDDSASYTIPIVLPEGFLIYRVRAIGEKLQQDILPKNQLWSLPDKCTIASLGNGFGKFVLQVDNYDNDLNWNFTNTYAEEGKYSEALVWFDGMLRNRQALGMDNENNLPLISSSIYDHLGREMVSAMASPFFDDLGYAYRDSINLNSTGNKYSYDDFDLNYNSTGLTDEIFVDSMSDLQNTGANYYYSANFNSDIQNMAFTDQVKRRHGFLPDADGYAFSQSEATNDGTGRMARTGSVGKTHQLTAYHANGNLETGKEVRTWDGTPFQEELWKMFGNEVGHYSNYKKVMTQDANGQISVAYIDLYGRTVATALAGKIDNTPSLDPIASSNYTTELDIRLGNTIDDLNQKQINHYFTVVQADTWEFTYAFNPRLMDPECDTQFCYHCAYNLTIDVKDMMGKSVLVGGPITTYVGSITDSAGCDTSVRFSLPQNPLKVYLDAGEYALTKTLTLNQAGLVENRENYFKQSGCVKPFTEFLADELNRLDITCELSCDECDEQLTAMDQKKDSIILWCAEALIDTSLHDDFNQIVEEIASLQEVCDEICEETGPCDVLYKNMLSDVSLGGQYMKYFSVDSTGQIQHQIGDAGFTTASILQDNWWDCNPGGSPNYQNWRDPEGGDYKDEDGEISRILVTNNSPESVSGTYEVINGKSYVRPHNLKYVTDFIRYWKNSWAESLVYMHPEYCYYTKCKAIEGSYDYDLKLIATESSAEAQEKGYYNPLNSGGLGSLQLTGGPFTIDYSNLETGSIERDPITLTSYYSSASTSLESLLKNHTYKVENTSGDCADTTLTIWQIYEQYRMDNGIASNVISQDTCIEDVFWPVLRALYLSVKQDWLIDYYTTECPSGTGCGDVIPSNLINVARWEGAADIMDLINVDPIWPGIDTFCKMDSLEARMDEYVASTCQTNCEQNVDQWLVWLNGCDQITNLTSTKLDSLKQDLIRLCVSGCDMDHPFGSISRAPYNGNLNEYPDANIHDVFVRYLGPDWFSEGICDDLLIQFPGYYGHDYLAQDDPKNMDCACDSVKWHTAASCPDLVIYDSIQENCECSYPHDLSMAKISKRHVFDWEKCQNCITCKDLNEPVYEFMQRYDSASHKLDSHVYQNLLTTWLNRYFGFNLTYEEYAHFAYDCVQDTNHNSTWLEVWNHIGLDRMVVINDNQIEHFDGAPSRYQHVYGNRNKVRNQLVISQPTIDLRDIIDLGYLRAPKDKNDNEEAALVQRIYKPGMEIPSIQGMQTPEAENIACKCERILTVGHMMDNGQNNGLSAEDLFAQLYGPWYGVNFNDAKNACCKLWNQQETDPPGGPCTPTGFEPGKQFDSTQVSFVHDEYNDVNDPAHDPIIDQLDGNCTPLASVNTDKGYLDTCGCKELKQIDEDYTSYVNSGGTLSKEAYAYQVKGFAIDNIDKLLEECEKMWNTGVKKGSDGQPNTSWTTTANWSKISTTNLKRYAVNMDWLLNESLLCNPKTEEPCLDHIPCGKLTKHFMRLWGEIGASTLMGSTPVPSDMVTYSEVPQQLGLLYDWMQFVDQQDPSGDEWTYKFQFLGHLKDSLNSIFSTCDEDREYSLLWFFARLRDCHKPRTQYTQPCLDELSCRDVGDLYRKFLIKNPKPDDNGYGPISSVVAARDLGELYDKYDPFEGVVTQQVQDMLDWLDDLELFFNKEYNHCYNKKYGTGILDLGEFLAWTYKCDTSLLRTYKAAPCPDCYVADTAYLEAFRGFLDHIVERPEPKYLHQSLWIMKGNGNFDITSFYGNPTLYNNGFSDSLEYILNEVDVPELDVTIEDRNGYTLEFNLLFPSAEAKWNFGEILEFIDIYPVKSGGCNPPNLFEVVAVYELPGKYWNSVDKPNCPNVKIGLKNYCRDTITLLGRFKNHHIGQQVSCLSCNRLCNKRFFRPIPKQDRCHTTAVRLAIENAFIRYDDYLTQMEKSFDSLYLASCMNSTGLNEETRLAYQDRTYHYTLYHYDRAGQLIKTVPPTGIDFENPSLSTTDRNLLINDRIEKAHQHWFNPISQPKAPIYHTLVTQYKYNSLGELIWSETPDGGITRAWYDNLARPVLSQDTNHADPTGSSAGKYGYVLYDELGRTIESGQIDRSTYGPGLVTHHKAATPNDLATILDASATPGDKTQIVQTQYNKPANGSRISSAFSDLGGQRNLRSSVASTTYEEVNDDDSTTYDQATYYTYDAMGNVNRLVQDIEALDPLEKNLFSIDYSYDLLSGNVHNTVYQKGKADQFAHKYEYDANNRLAGAYSSRDNYSWQRDASYEYYLHGALARKELGELTVQGIDYAYTLHGWLKSVNAPIMDATLDIGWDGNTVPGNTHQYVARDAFSFDLGYFNGDYAPVHGAAFGPTTNGSDLMTQFSPLYNGNIGRMNTSIADSTGYANHNMVGDIMGNIYRYDQLNRISIHRVYQNINSNQTQWLNQGYDGKGVYYEDFSYDASGNITALNRHGHNPLASSMDSFVYRYDQRSQSAPIGGGISWQAMVSNKLYHVNDNATGSYSGDIDDQGAFNSTPTLVNGVNNYGYDGLGNLIRDDAEQIEKITWTATGKVKSIKRVSGSTKPDLEFGYDAFDNRLYKTVKPKYGSGALKNQVHWKTQYYIYDGAGVLMATYNRSYGEDQGLYADSLALNQFMVYGAERLGSMSEDTLLVDRQFTGGFDQNGAFTSKNYDPFSLNVVYQYQEEVSLTVHGLKQYELANHLGNVLATIQDRKQMGDTLVMNGLVDYYIPYIVSTQDYYAFGSLMESRGFALFSVKDSSYAYGFQGQEMDNEITSEGDYLSYKYRIHDARLGRFLSVDPLAPKYSYLSTYQFSSNCVIAAVELEGLESSRIFNGNELQLSNMSTPGHNSVDLSAGQSFVTNGSNHVSSIHYGESFYTWSNEANDYAAPAYVRDMHGIMTLAKYADEQRSNLSQQDELGTTNTLEVVREWDNPDHHFEGMVYHNYSGAPSWNQSQLDIPTQVKSFGAYHRGWSNRTAAEGVPLFANRLIVQPYMAASLIGGGVAWGMAEHTEAHLLKTGLFYRNSQGVVEGVIHNSKFAFRSITSRNGVTLASGDGIFAKNPAGNWSLEQHLVGGSSPASIANDPWISTSLDIRIARAFQGESGLVRIDLTKVPSIQQRGFESLPINSAGYRYSVWQQEVSIYQHVPQEAIFRIKLY